MYGQCREFRFFQRSRRAAQTQSGSNLYLLEKSQSAEIETIYDIESQKKESMAKKGIEHSTKMIDINY